MFRFNFLNASFKCSLVFFGSLMLVGAAAGQAKRGTLGVDPGIGGSAYVGTTGLGSQVSLTPHQTLYDVGRVRCLNVKSDQPVGHKHAYRHQL